MAPPALAYDSPAYAKGLDRPGLRRRPEGGGLLEGRTRYPYSPILPSTSARLRSGCAATAPRSSSTRRATRPTTFWPSAPKGDRRMGMNPHANGGKLLKDLRMPDFRDYGVDVPFPGSVEASDMTELGKFVRDIYKLNSKERNFRAFGPDETNSNRLQAVFEETDRIWDAEELDIDDHLAPPTAASWDSMLSEHVCQGNARGLSAHGVATASSTATRPSSASWTACSASTPSGSRSATSCPGGRTSPASTTSSPGNVWAAGPQRLHPSGTPASSTTSPTRRRTSCASTCPPMPTAC